MVRISVAHGLMIAAFALLAVSGAQAAYEGLEFNTIIDDGSGDGVFNADIISLAVAEPGDNTLVWRLEVASTELPGAAGSIDMFMDGDFRNGWAFDGTCDDVFTDNVVEGNVFYCTLPYSAAGAKVGDTLTGIVLRSYLGLVMDYAPGGFPGVLGSDSATYTLVGSTALAVEVPEEPAGPAPVQTQTFYHDITDTELWVQETFSEPTNDTYVYNWTAPSGDLAGSYEALVEAGGISAAFLDQNGTVLFSFSGSESADDLLSFEGLTDRRLGLAVQFGGFVGSWSFGLSDATPADDGAVDDQTAEDPEIDHQDSVETGGEAGNEDSHETGGFSSESEDSPGLGFITLLGAMAAALVAFRRR